jgi:hypothetical protein
MPINNKNSVGIATNKRNKKANTDEIHVLMSLAGTVQQFYKE